MINKTVLDNKKFIGWLPFVLSIVVIFQAVMLVTSLRKGTTKAVIPTASQITEVVKKEKEDLTFKVDSSDKAMKIGKNYIVSVSVLSVVDVAVDGADVYIKYDPKAFTVSNLKQADGLPNLAYKNIKENTGIVSAGVYITDKEGLKLQNKVEKKLLTFEVKPLVAGNFSFDLTTRKDGIEFATMIVETSTRKVLPFSIEKLNVSVIGK